MRREAQLAALRYDEERQKSRCVQRDSASSYTKVPSFITAASHRSLSARSNTDKGPTVK